MNNIVIAACCELDVIAGPPGAVMLGRTLSSMGFAVKYVTDTCTAPLMQGM